MKLLYFIFMANILSCYANAESSSVLDNFSERFENIGLTAGSLTEFVGSIQTNSSGETNRFELDPLIAVSTHFMLTPHWYLAPEIAYVLPRSAEERITKHLVMFRLDGMWKPWKEWLNIRLGTSMMVNHMTADGGTREINNGNGTSTFFVPAETRTSVNNTLDFGLEGVYKNVSLRSQAYVYSLTRSDRRQWSYVLSFTFYFDLRK